MTFKLKSLLKLRRNQEKEKWKLFAEINAHLTKQRNHLGFVSKVQQGKFKSFDNQMRGNSNSNILKLYNDFFEGSRYQEQRSKLIISEVEEKLESRRKDLTEAMRKRKTLELLEQKEAEELKNKKIKRELEKLDESASILWRRSHL